MLNPVEIFTRWVFSLFLECYCFPLLIREVSITVHHSFSCRSSLLKINPLNYSLQTWSYLNLLTFPHCSFRHWACQEESLGLISVGQFDAEEHVVRNWDLWRFCCLNLLCASSLNVALTNFSEEHIPQGRSQSSWKSVTVAQFNVGEKGLSVLLYCGLLSTVLTSAWWQYLHPICSRISLHLSALFVLLKAPFPAFFFFFLVCLICFGMNV